MFTFDVHDDIRVMHDASVETEESHAGKVLLRYLSLKKYSDCTVFSCSFLMFYYDLFICFRSWYERNKHIFPASRWEPFDPTKSYDKYTVSDKNRKKDKI